VAKLSERDSEKKKQVGERERKKKKSFFLLDFELFLLPCLLSLPFSLDFHPLLFGVSLSFLFLSFFFIFFFFLSLPFSRGPSRGSRLRGSRSGSRPLARGTVSRIPCALSVATACRGSCGPWPSCSARGVAAPSSRHRHHHYCSRRTTTRAINHNLCSAINQSP
jgi:hypothetical protein